MSLYLSTLNRAKIELGLSDTKDDANLTTWMEGLQGRFVDHCGREFLRAVDRTDVLTGDGGHYLMLPLFPLESVSSVKCATDGDFAAAAALVEFEDFVAQDARGRLVAINWTWPTHPGGIQVVYTAGYLADGETETPALPAALRRAFLLQLGYEWRNRLNLGKASVSAQGQSVQLAPARLLPEVEEALAPYRRIL